mgnify:CR=1 FL=1
MLARLLSVGSFDYICAFIPVLLPLALTISHFLIFPPLHSAAGSGSHSWITKQVLRVEGTHQRRRREDTQLEGVTKAHHSPWMTFQTSPRTTFPLPLPPNTPSFFPRRPQPRSPLFPLVPLQTQSRTRARARTTAQVQAHPHPKPP